MTYHNHLTQQTLKIIALIVFLGFVIQVKSTADSESDLKNIHVQKRLQQKLKQERHSKSIKSCENIDDWHPHIKSDYFILTGLDHEHYQDDLSSINAVSPLLDSCSNQSQIIELQWRYQFFESMHCLKVELNLRNSTKFIELAKYKYYSFSYRELGRKNKFQPRQLINESVNSLIIKNTNLRPYIICVTFYKGDYFSHIPAAGVASNETSINDTNDLDCGDYTRLFTRDKQTHDVDLCVDIDTQAHFLTDISHHGYSNAELIMVGFIVIITLALLTIITITHTLIQKPKVKRFREYLHHRLHSHTHHHHHHHDHKGSDEKHLHRDNGSSAHSLHSNNDTHLSLNNHNHETKDEQLIIESVNLLSPESAMGSGGSSTLNKNESYARSVKFDLADTILEDNEEDTFSTNAQEDNADKYINHLLNDKPWSSSRSNSIAHLKENNP